MFYFSRDFSEWSSTKSSTRSKRSVQNDGNDASAYMKDKFGIEDTSQFTIFDIVNAMSSSDAEKSTGTNGVAKNQLACNALNSDLTPSDETLCTDFGGTIVRRKIGGVESFLCFLEGSEKYKNYSPEKACKNMGGFNTSVHVFPFMFEDSYDFCKYTKYKGRVPKL